MEKSDRGIHITHVLGAGISSFRHSCNCQSALDRQPSRRFFFHISNTMQKTKNTKQTHPFKVAIIGGRDGGYVAEQISRVGNWRYEVACLADNDSTLWGKPVSGIPVCPVSEAIEQYHKGEIDCFLVAVRKGYSRFRIIEQLSDAGITKIMLIKPSVLTYRLPMVFEDEDPLYKLQWLNASTSKKPVIHHLEANLADGCNLNCRGCLHFSNLYGKDEFPDSAELLGTIAEIARHCEIFQFRVLGGEPLLNPDLEEFLRNLRKILPDTDLAVISNGILIPKMAESLFQAMRDNYIGFNLTLYPPTLNMKERIYATLDGAGVAYGSHEARTDKFEKFLRRQPGNTDSNSYDTCVPRGILTVKGKCLYRCPVEAFIGRYYERFGIDLKAPDGIDVFQFDGDWKQLVNDLYTKPRPLCKYCSAESELYEWSNGKPQKEDWLAPDKD